MDAYIACHDCDLIHRIDPLPGKGRPFASVAVPFYTSTNPTVWIVPWHLPWPG